MTIIPLEFEGEKALPETFAPGYDCRICMILRGADEDAYVLRTQKDQRVGKDGELVFDTGRILPGEMAICLPDHHYAHADHDAVERVLYAEMLEARLPVDEANKIQVGSWKMKQVMV
jgi:hypothetical protein